MFTRSGMGLESLHFSEFPDDASAAGLWAIF